MTYQRSNVPSYSNPTNPFSNFKSTIQSRIWHKFDKSSPPSLPRISEVRMIFIVVSAVYFNTSSPIGCPHVSLIRLKWSKYRIRWKMVRDSSLNLPSPLLSLYLKMAIIQTYHSSVTARVSNTSFIFFNFLVNLIRSSFIL